MIWNKRKETLPESKMRKLQSQALKDLVKRVYDNVPFYKEKMDKLGVSPKDIKSIADISKLPFTTKEEMRETYPLGLLATERKDIVEIHTSSGTTGKPVVDAYTRGDIELWSEVMARTLSMGGVTQDDIIQNAYGYGLFTGGLGVHYGGRKIGATVLPISGGNTKRQLMIMQDFKSTALTCTPSYTLYLAEVMAEENINPQTLALKVGFFGAEPWSDSMRKEIEKKLDLMALDIYGLTEIIGPGVSSECSQKDGLHIFEDVFYPEIINPETGEVLPEGEKGELVITTLTKEGTPIIRYRTRDITYLTRGQCSCGRTSVKMHRLLGRTDDMLIIRGVNVFPSQIEEALLKVEKIEPHYHIFVDRQDNLDSLTVQVEVAEKFFSDEVKELEILEKNIKKAIEDTVGIKVGVQLVEPKTVARSEGKAKRVTDNRRL